jgi:hypothetical protein
LIKYDLLLRANLASPQHVTALLPILIGRRQIPNIVVKSIDSCMLEYVSRNNRTMKKTFITAILTFFFNSAYSQGFEEMSGDSITDLEFAKHFFEIDLPDSFELKVNPHGSYGRNNLVDDDDTTYSYVTLSFNMAGIDIVMEQDTSVDISVYSLISGRWDNVPDSSEYAETINITYYQKRDDWFVISGIGRYSGEMLYIKVYFGEKYISILRLQYAREKRALIEPYISQLSKSLKSY